MLKLSENFISIKSSIFKRSAMLLMCYYLQESFFSRKKVNIRREKKKSLSSASNQGGVREVRFPLSLPARKLDWIYEMMALTHWTTDHDHWEKGDRR